jgi:hypothetical protein
MDPCFQGLPFLDRNCRGSHSMDLNLIGYHSWTETLDRFFVRHVRIRDADNGWKPDHVTRGVTEGTAGHLRLVKKKIPPVK